MAPFAKSDIIKYRKIYDYANPTTDEYELVVVANFGESDRIDVEHIEKEHINKFLKNVCVLLKEIKHHSNIYHGNI